MKARATMNGAISIVNAIAAGKGATLGISFELTAEVELSPGRGIEFLTGRSTDRLVTTIVTRSFPKEVLERNQVTISIRSQIPIGFGLKSSSAVSNAISLACARLASETFTDDEVIQTAVESSLAAGVSITGAMDDAAACYYGGLVLTDNHQRRIIRRDPAPVDLLVVIFLPRRVARGNVANLRTFATLFGKAFDMADSGDYWNAMILNGVLAASALSNPYSPVLSAIEAGALGASISGNGPSVAAVVREDAFTSVQKAFSEFDGKVMTSRVNNKKAGVELIDNG